MSTQNILDKNNLSTNRAMSEYLASESIEMLKKRRFDVGCPNIKQHRLMLTLYRLSCEDWCSSDSEQRDSIREEVILRTAKKITEL